MTNAESALNSYETGVGSGLGLALIACKDVCDRDGTADDCLEAVYKLLGEYVPHP